jgi:hypothetical protein
MPTNFRNYACSLPRIYYLIVLDLQFGLTFLPKFARYLLAQLGNERPLRKLQCFSKVDMREARTKEGCTGHIRAKRSAYSPLPLQVGHGGQGRETFVRQFRLR